ncbi:MAG: hypothetical protein ACXVH1_37065 [Solirubrobacteraceae bacterium]
MDAYEVRDADDQRVLALQDVGPSWRTLGLTKWRYELSMPDEPEAISVSRVRRLTDTASITQGPLQIGMIRSRVEPRSVTVALRMLGSPGRRKSPAFALEDHDGRQVACIYIACKRGPYERVDLIVDVKDGTSEQLRKIAVATSVIADRELIDFAESSSFGP